MGYPALPAGARSSTESRWHVLVVGAGPAGCAAASSLATRGLSVLVAERGSTGRDKVCGDALGAFSVEALGRLGISAATLHLLGGRRFNEVVIRRRGAAGSQSLVADGWVVPRAVLDQELRDRVAPFVRIEYELEVREVRFDGCGFTATCSKRGETLTLHAEAVVLACGAYNRLARQYGVDGSPRLGASLTSYFAGQQLAVPVFELGGFRFRGYGWAFPFGSSELNVGVCCLEEHGKSGLRSAFEGFLHEAVTAAGAEKTRGGTAPLWSGLGTFWHYDRGLIACGDVAGLADPVTGEGIRAALESGHRAGLAVGTFLDQARRVDALTEYTLWVHKTYSFRYAANPKRAWFGAACRPT